MDIQSDVAKKLLQIKAIKLNPQNPYTWASGIQSPIYCDNRIVLSYPKVRSFLIDCLATQSKDFGNFNMIAGVATAGIAHGALLAAALEKPFVYVRSKSKGHGRLNLVEGEIRGNERVLVIEDLISTGGSSLKAVQALEDHGCRIAGVLAIFSYGFDRAKQAFEAEDCILKTLTNYEILIQEAVACNYINEADLENLQEWRKDPEQWGSKFSETT